MRGGVILANMSRWPWLFVILLMACNEARPTPTADPATAAPSPATSSPPPTNTAVPAIAASDEAPRDRGVRPDGSEVKKIVHGEFLKLRGCYEAGLRRDPKLGGRLLINFTIGKDGRASRVEVVARTVVSNKPENVRLPFPDQQAIGCIRQVFTTMRFARRNEPLDIGYPIDFSAG